MAQILIRDFRNQFVVKANASVSGRPEISTITTSAIGLNSKSQFLFPDPYPGQPQIVLVEIFLDWTGFASGDWLAIDSGHGSYNYFWFNVNGAGGDPGFDPEFEVPIFTGYDVPTITDVLTGIINSTGAFIATDNGDGTISVSGTQNTSDYGGPGGFATNVEFDTLIIQNGADPGQNGINTGDWIRVNTPFWNGTNWTSFDAYYVWFNVDGSGGDPGFANEIEVGISSFDTGATVSEAVAIAISSSSFVDFFTASVDGGNSSICDINNNLAANSTAPSTSSGAILVNHNQTGVNSDIEYSATYLANGSIILLNTPSTNYYLWFLVGGTGSNPVIAGRTAIQVNISFSSSGTALATAIKNAINAGAVGKMTAISASNLVTITNVTNGSVADISKQQIGPGTTVAVTQQGN